MKILYRLWVVGTLCYQQQAFGMLAAMQAAEGKGSSSAKKTTANPMEDAMAKAASSAPKKAPSTNPMEAAMAKSAGAKKTTSDNPMHVAKAKSTSNDENKSDHKTSSSAKTTTATPELEVTDVHSSGLDTINIDSSGNWLEKRIWFEKGEDLFDEIRTVVKKAADIRMKFVHEVNTIGKKIDEFYEHVNFDKGQVDQMLKNILDESVKNKEIKNCDTKRVAELILTLSEALRHRELYFASLNFNKSINFKKAINEMVFAINLMFDGLSNK